LRSLAAFALPAAATTVPIAEAHRP